MDAGVFLKQYKKNASLIENKKKDRQRWEEISMNIVSQMGGERVQSSGSKEKMANAVVEAVEVDREIQSCKNAMKKVLKVIEELEVREYEFAYKHYIEYMTLGEIANQEGKSSTWAGNMNKKVKASVQEILDRRG